MTRKPCPGCSRLVGAATGWCAACGLRLPADLSRAVAQTHARHERAVGEAVRWLQTHPYASARDLEVLALVAQGLRLADVAGRLGLSEHTVRDHLRRMSRRWGCRGRAQLVATAYQLGYLKIRTAVGGDR